MTLEGWAVATVIGGVVWVLSGVNSASKARRAGLIHPMRIIGAWDMAKAVVTGPFGFWILHRYRR